MLVVATVYMHTLDLTPSKIILFGKHTKVQNYEESLATNNVMFMLFITMVSFATYRETSSA